MKKLGLIGGTGPESTIEYYRQIEYGVQEKAGCFPNLVIESLSVFDVLRTDYILVKEENFDRALKILASEGYTVI